MKKGLGRSMDGRASFLGFRLLCGLICPVLLGWLVTLATTWERTTAQPSVFNLSTCTSPVAVVRRPQAKKKRWHSRPYHFVLVASFAKKSTELNGTLPATNQKTVSNSMGSALRLSVDSMVARLSSFRTPVIAHTNPPTQVVSGVGDGISRWPLSSTIVSFGCSYPWLLLRFFGSQTVIDKVGHWESYTVGREGIREVWDRPKPDTLTASFCDLRKRFMAHPVGFLTSISWRSSRHGFSPSSSSTRWMS
jgi:hypothetical protein